MAPQITPLYPDTRVERWCHTEPERMRDYLNISAIDAAGLGMEKFAAAAPDNQTDFEIKCQLRQYDLRQVAPKLPVLASHDHVTVIGRETLASR